MDSKFLRDLGTAAVALKRVVVPKISRAGISLTYDCNQRCKTCDLWKVNKDKPELRSSEMTLDDFARFSEKNSSLLWLALTGGEPFLKKDMKGFLDICCTMTNLRLISITTNGSVPGKIEDDLGHFLRNKNQGITVAVQVSFEGPEEVHNDICGTPGSYQRALKTLRLVNRLSRETSRVRPGISFTLSSFGEGYLQSTLESLKEDLPNWGCIQLGIGQEASYYQWTDHKNVKASPESLVRDLTWFGKKFPIRGRLDPYAGISYAYLKKASDCYRNGQHFPKCVAAEYSCSIDPYLDVHPCIFMFDYSLGNLRDYNFDLNYLLRETRPIWKKKVSDCIAKGGCWNLCEAYSAILFRPWRVL